MNLNLDYKSYNYVHNLRPWSVDSLNGGSTDALKKAPVEKKNGQNLGGTHLWIYKVYRKV